jgi:hypothetical protein
VDVVLHDWKGKTYLILDVAPFDETPLICRRNGPAGKGLERAGVYWRPPGVPRTERVQDSRDMREMIEIAAEKMARRILEVRQRTEPRAEGLTGPTVVSDRFTQELGDL